MKICAKCNIEKKESEFFKDKRRKDGLYGRCKECFNKAQRETYHANIEISREKNRLKQKARYPIIKSKRKKNIISTYPNTEKYCPKCKTVKKAIEFSRHSQKPDGLYNYCKKCSLKENKEYRKDNALKIKEKKHRSFKKNKNQLSYVYVKRLLKTNYSEDVIKKHPELIEIKKIQVISHRVKRKKLK